MDPNQPRPFNDVPPPLQHSQYQEYPAPARRPKWLPIALTCGAGCGLFLLVLVVAGVFAFRGASNSMKTADPVARQFMQLVSDAKDADAYALADTKMKAMSSLGDFKRFAGMWRAGQGRL